jgi:cytochrome bd ubiquinol oxidase subunit II
MLDYAVLRVIWWVLLGVLLIGFAILDGFDFGVASLLPWLSRNDHERRILINSIGPVWESNQVWLVLGGGALFAAWPAVYATAFSCLYLAMMLLLLCFILRPVAFKYRNKQSNQRWRTSCDTVLCVTGLAAPLLLGVAVGNALKGIPFVIDETARVVNQGSFLSLLNPFALLCGLLSVAMCIQQGACYLATKTLGHLHTRTLRVIPWAGVITLLLFAVGGLMIAWQVKGYSLASGIATAGSSNVLHKHVIQTVGAWLTNYRVYPFAIIAPLLGFAGTFFAIAWRKIGRGKLALCCSSLSLAGIISTVGVSMFPFILPSSHDPNVSLMVWDASSSQLTLFLMLLVTLVLLPIVLLYIRWAYHIMRGRISEQDIQQHSHELY